MLTRLLRSRLLRLFVGMTLVLTFVGAAGYGWLQWELGKISRFDAQTNAATRVETEPSASATPTEILPDVVRILVFSTGSSGLEEGDGARLGIGNSRAGMRDGLTDSLMLLSLRPASGRIDMLSLPRDLWLEEHGHRINESYVRRGVWALVDDIETLTGLRADHAVAVNFAAFADLTDAIGGVNIQFDNPVRDAKAKLDIPAAGCVKLQGSNALAFVRSRHWQVFRDGSWRADATSSDWGRIERQQSFIRAISQQLLDWRLPSKVPALLGVARDNLMLDQELTLSRLVSIASAFSTNGVDIHASTYPGRGGTTDQGASVIFPDREAGLALAASSEAAANNPTPSLGTASASVAPTTIPTQVAGLNGSAGSAAAANPTPSASASTSRGFTPARDGTGGTRFRTCTPAQ